MGKKIGRVEFEPGFFQMLLNSPAVVNLTRESADRVAEQARKTAPVDTGAYRDGITVVENRLRDRTAFSVSGEDWKSLIVEARTGNLLRAARSVKG